MAKTKKKDGLGVGGIIGLVVAALLLIGILAGVVLYVHSGRAGLGESAGILAADDNTAVTLTLEEEKEAAAKEAAENGKGKRTTEKESAEKTKKSSDTDGKAAETSEKAETFSGEVTYQAKASAKTLGAMYDADVDAFRKAYDGKSVTVTGKLKDKSSKMLYVELDTGTKVPLRVYLNTEEQREQFNMFEKGRGLTVKGTVAVLYPQSPDAGGFQEMANGLIALDTVTLVK
ncbi:MAG: hypothetical protein ILO43_01725 [Clostridia bacterium]|nr:hypothetical protein [Clostridia bacterium]MBP5271672.1 hypothetical protein [Clostridia bacterium]